MGALVAVDARSKEELDRMVRFMGQNFRSDKTLMPWISMERGPMPGPRAGKDLAAYAKRRQIGYYFNAGYEYASLDYGMALIRWMALKIGKAAMYKRLGTRLPYYCYESDRLALIAPTSEEVVGDDRDCDVLHHALGYKRSHSVTPELLALFEADPDMNPYTLKSVKDRIKAEPLIIEELGRLDRLWEPGSL